MDNDKIFYENRIRELEESLQNTMHTLDEYKKQHDEFIHIASHDLQSPLRKLSTFVERLSHKCKDAAEDDAKSYIERIVKSVATMRALIDNLASLSMVTASDENYSKCDLNQLLHDVLIESNEIIPGINTIVTFSDLPVVKGNASQLHHLFQELINNSIKFKPLKNALAIKIDSEGMSEEEIKASGLNADKIFYRITIADNGIGFDEAYSKKIFQPFERLHGKSEFEGHGLGLAICKKIMEKHHGIIYANGVKNAGACFTLILPVTPD